MINYDNFIFDTRKKDYIKKLIINDNIKFLFVGENETGKTTFINSIINKFFVDETYSLLKINNYNDISINYFRQDVKQFCQINNLKNKIIIIDDIDLIKDTCQHILSSLLNRYKNLYFICSCKNIRKINDNIIDKSIIFEMEKMNNLQIRQFINIYISKYNLNISEDSIKYIIDNCDNYPSIIINNLKCLTLFKMPITLQLTVGACEIIQTNTFANYFEYIKKGQLKEADNVLMSIYSKCVSLVDMVEFLYRYIKKCDETRINNNTKLNLIKIVSKYKLLLNILHEKKIEIYFITRDIYHEMQQNI
jgi:DNA polymerase III delta prime subunit